MLMKPRVPPSMVTDTINTVPVQLTNDLGYSGRATFLWRPLFTWTSDLRHFIKCDRAVHSDPNPHDGGQLLYPMSSVSSFILP